MGEILRIQSPSLPSHCHPSATRAAASCCLLPLRCLLTLLHDAWCMSEEGLVAIAVDAIRAAIRHLGEDGDPADPRVGQFSMMKRPVGGTTSSTSSPLTSSVGGGPEWDRLPHALKEGVFASARAFFPTPQSEAADREGGACRRNTHLDGCLAHCREECGLTLVQPLADRNCLACLFSDH